MPSLLSLYFHLALKCQGVLKRWLKPAQTKGSNVWVQTQQPGECQAGEAWPGLWQCPFKRGTRNAYFSFSFSFCIISKQKVCAISKNKRKRVFPNALNSVQQIVIHHSSGPAFLSVQFVRSKPLKWQFNETVISFFYFVLRLLQISITVISLSHYWRWHRNSSQANPLGAFRLVEKSHTLTREIKVKKLIQRCGFIKYHHMWYAFNIKHLSINLVGGGSWLSFTCFWLLQRKYE